MRRGGGERGVVSTGGRRRRGAVSTGGRRRRGGEGGTYSSTASCMEVTTVRARSWFCSVITLEGIPVTRRTSWPLPSDMVSAALRLSLPADCWSASTRPLRAGVVGRCRKAENGRETPQPSLGGFPDPTRGLAKGQRGSGAGRGAASGRLPQPAPRPMPTHEFRVRVPPRILLVRWAGRTRLERRGSGSQWEAGPADTKRERARSSGRLRHTEPRVFVLAPRPPSARASAARCAVGSMKGSATARRRGGGCTRGAPGSSRCSRPSPSPR